MEQVACLLALQLLKPHDGSVGAQHKLSMYSSLPVRVTGGGGGAAT